MTITTIILTKNSEKDIERCLESLSWSDEILVIDDNSADETLALVKKHGVKIIKRALEEDFSKQRNFALKQAKGDWILFVDSDEVISKDLAQEIRKAIEDKSTVGYYVQRKDTIWRRDIQHGESGNIFLLRLARKGSGVWSGEVHETWHVKGEVKRLHNTLNHYPHPSLSEFLTDINWYTTIRARELYAKGVKTHWYDVLFYPKAKFFQNYIIKKGFLDGTIGLILAVLMSFHSFLVRSKLWQLQKNK